MKRLLSARARVRRDTRECRAAVSALTFDSAAGEGAEDTEVVVAADGEEEGRAWEASKLNVASSTPAAVRHTVEPCTRISWIDIASANAVSGSCRCGARSEWWSVRRTEDVDEGNHDEELPKATTGDGE